MNKKIVWKMLLLVALLMVASPLFGQTPNNPTANGHWVAISAGFSMAIASGMCGLAQAKAVAAAAEGMARNPGAAAAIRFALPFGARSHAPRSVHAVPSIDPYPYLRSSSYL